MPPKMITITMSEVQYGNLQALLTAGAKSPHTDRNFVIAGGQLMVALDEQVANQNQPKADPSP